jgi:hypothetical protein
MGALKSRGIANVAPGRTETIPEIQKKDRRLGGEAKS